MKKILLFLVAILAISLSSFAQLWIEQASGFSTASRGINYVSVVDANIVWAAAYDGSGGGAYIQEFTKTLNGGTTWTPGTINNCTGMEPAMIFAVSGTKAYCPMFRQTGSNPQGIYYTSNGGTTWTRQTTALFSNASSFPNCVHFFDENTGWCMGDPINTPAEFEIYTTTDGGTTWTVVPGSQIPNPLSGEFGVVGYYCAVNDTIWFGTNKGRVYKSVDKGHNYTVSTQISGWTSIYTIPVFKDGTNGLAQDKSGTGTIGRIAESTDGGATFTALTPTLAPYYNDIVYIPGSPNTYLTTGAAQGFSGVRYSFDGGHNWIEMTDWNGVQFLATDFLNDSVGWAGGFNADASTGGMYKFNSTLALPVADFASDFTGIHFGGQIHFFDQSTGNPISYAWTFQGGTPGTSSAKNPVVTYNQPGSYDVTLKVTNEFGDNTITKSDFIYVGGVGINEQSRATVTIFPNPVNDYVTIQASGNLQEIQVINTVGQVVINQKTDNKEITLNTSSLKAGVYNLKIKLADGFINKKIIVN